MAIMKIPQVGEVKDKPKVEITPKTYETPVADTRKENYNTLATFAEGYKWSCDFYLRAVSGDTTSAGFDLGGMTIYSQYRKIKSFELIVESPLSIQQESNQERNFTVTGSAKVYSTITPNEGDFFIADIGDGRNGLFSITRVTRSTIYKESFTSIDYRQIRLMDVEVEHNIERRVVDTVYFDRELMRGGLKPLITTQEVDVSKRLMKAYRRLTNLYLHEFVDNEVKTLIVPNQQIKSYDPYMTRFVLRTFDKTVCNRLGDVLELNQYHKSGTRTLSVLDALESVDADLLWSVSRKVAFNPITHYKAHPYFMSIYHSGVMQVLSFLDKPFTNDTQDTLNVGTSSMSDGGVKKPLEHFLTPSLVGKPNIKPEIPYVHPIMVDDHYIFSRAFYDETEGQSSLEVIVRKRLEHEAFDVSLLADIADQADRFDNLERFYYIPIILALIKMSPGVL